MIVVPGPESAGVGVGVAEAVGVALAAACGASTVGDCKLLARPVTTMATKKLNSHAKRIFGVRVIVCRL